MEDIIKREKIKRITQQQHISLYYPWWWEAIPQLFVFLKDVPSLLYCSTERVFLLLDYRFFAPIIHSNILKFLHEIFLLKFIEDKPFW